MKSFKISGTCVDLSSEGKGVIKDKENVYFINSLFIGEKCEATITHFSNHIGYGYVTKLISISKDRVESKCPIHSSCGGCVFQNYRYESQLKYKEKKVIEDLKRIGKLEKIPLEKISPSKEIYGYRNKLEVPLKENKKGKIEAGFFKEYSHEIIPIKSCPIQNPLLFSVVNDCLCIFNDLKIRAYDEDKRTGILRHLLLKSSLNNGHVLLSVVINNSELPGSKEFVKRITKLHPEIQSISLNYNLRKTNVILGEREKIIFGKGFIIDEILGNKFRVSTSSFFQVNPCVVKDLYSYVKKKLNNNKSSILVPLGFVLLLIDTFIFPILLCGAELYELAIIVFLVGVIALVIMFAMILAIEH